VFALIAGATLVGVMRVAGCRGGELAYLHNGRRETSVEYRPRIGVPVVGFSIDSYWDRYYRGRAWYGVVTAPVGVPRGESVTTITVAAPRASARRKVAKTRSTIEPNVVN
jgi:hypothetical protein